MGETTKIQWSDATWSPIRAEHTVKTGPQAGQVKIGWHCEHDSPGCENCYAESMNLRVGTGLPFKPGHRDDIEIFLDQKMLMKPLAWQPSMIFVCSMTDIFADFVTDDWLDQMFAIMAMCHQHTFQVLTKRSARMLAYCSVMAEGKRNVGRAAKEIALSRDRNEIKADRIAAQVIEVVFSGLPNVWMGVSVEDQRRKYRIDNLRATPAARRFLSCEPLLEDLEDIDLTGIHQVIVGGESGTSARDCDLAWLRGIVRQCREQGSAPFMKQLGARPVQDGTRYPITDPKGGDQLEWPEDLRVREYPNG